MSSRMQKENLLLLTDSIPPLYTNKQYINEADVPTNY